MIGQGLTHDRIKTARLRQTQNSLELDDHVALRAVAQAPEALQDSREISISIALGETRPLVAIAASKPVKSTYENFSP